MAPHPVSSVDCFSTKLRFDEWDHACSQPGGVQWGARIRQHRGELSAETETILIATGATSANDGHENVVGHATSVHAKLDEQCAELHGVLPAGLMVDIQGGDRAQRVTARLSTTRRRVRFAASTSTRLTWHEGNLVQPHRVLLELRQIPHTQAGRPRVRSSRGGLASDDRGSLGHTFREGLAARASPIECRPR